MRVAHPPSFTPKVSFLSEPISIQQVTNFKPPVNSDPILIYSDRSVYYGDADPINQVPHGLGIMLFKHLDRAPVFATKQTSFMALFEEGDRYGGWWKDGVFNDVGVLIRSDFTYFGSWSSGKPHGRGFMRYEKNYVDSGEGPAGFGKALWRGLSRLSPFEDSGHKPQEYKGDFHRDHHRHGEGRLRYFNGDVYEGSWIANCRNGFGKLIQADGEQYEGHWLNDERHGRGIIRYPDGRVFKGVIEHNKQQGLGTLRLSNGDEYEGMFSDNKLEGNGMMRYKNGDVYEGQWKDGLRHGEGKYTLKKTGATMQGTFSRGLIHGKGTVELPQISLFSGTFIRGIRSEGTMYWSEKAEAEFENTLCYQGEWKGEFIEGRGLMWFRDGGVYYGAFRHNQLHGKGNRRFSNGDEYSGYFRANQPHGWGITQNKDGDIQAGLWKDGKLVEGYVGGWDGEKIHGLGSVSVASSRVLFPSGKNFKTPDNGSPEGSPSGGTAFIQFRGMFHHGDREGPGILKLPASGKGGWDSLLVKEDKTICKSLEASQHIIKGNWKNNQLNGSLGIWSFPSGEVYVGGFVNNKREDHCGKVWLPDGSFYVGGWSQNAPSGRGIFFSSYPRDDIFLNFPSQLEAASSPAPPPDQDHNASKYGVNYLMGLFRSPTPKSGGSSPVSVSREEEEGRCYHYVLVGKWEQRVWSVKRCERFISPRLVEQKVNSNEKSRHSNSEAVVAWVDGPKAVRQVTHFSSAEVMELSTALKLPLNISVGKLEGDGIVVFSSGIVLFSSFAENHPQIDIPFRAHSQMDHYLRHLNSVSGEEKTLKIPYYSSPFTQKMKKMEMKSISPVLSRGLWKPFSFFIDEDHDNAVSPSPTSCTFCGTEFSIFRRVMECSLCFRAACGSCLQVMEPGISPSVASVLSHSKKILRQLRDENECADENKPDGSLICGDCARAVREHVSRAIIWLPLRIFSSLMEPSSGYVPGSSDGGTSQSDTSEPIRGSVNRSLDEIFASTHSDNAGEDPIAHHLWWSARAQDTRDFVTYAGYAAGAVPHLLGEMWWGGESYYVGPFDHGERSGFGYQAFSNGEVFRGVFKHNTWNGYGLYFFLNGAVLEGIFKDGKLERPMYHGELSPALKYHGLGIRFDDDGTRYNGQWVEGKKHGRGTLHYIDGCLFAGSFVKDRIEGEGKLITGSSVYYGSFQDGKKEGKAVEFFSGCVVQGTWTDDAAHGFCRIFDQKTRDVYETTYEHGNERDDCFPLPKEINDVEVITCTKCKRSFYLLLRRHHCRLCGEIFCDSCTRQRAVLPAHFPVPSRSLQRVCDACFQRQQQRRTIAIRFYGTGEVYAGCWSQGRWVSHGLYTRPDGIFVVMDEHGVPIHLSSANMSSPVKSAVCRDASPMRSVLQEVKESSSFAALELFIEWWSKAQKDCVLDVPLQLSVVANFQQHQSYFGTRNENTAKMGSHDAALLSSVSVPIAVSPSMPTVPAPPQFSAECFHSTPPTEKFGIVESVWRAALNPPAPPETGSYASKFTSSTTKNYGVPPLDQYDVKECDLVAKMEELVAASTPMKPGPILQPTPPLPRYGSDNRIQWNDWEVKALPRLWTSALSATEADPIEEELHLMRSCPFWRPDAIDVERVVELGKVSRAHQLLEGRDDSLSFSEGWIPGAMPSPLVLEECQLTPCPSL